MYHLATLLVAILYVISGLRVLAQSTATLSYDTTYDNSDLSLASVACSDGKCGLESKGYTTLGSLAAFPNVGGVFTVTGWNSSQCGTCYAVTFGSNTVNILAVDRSKFGFTVSQTAMDTLTNNQAVALGSVAVTYVTVDPSLCGL